MPLLLSIFLIVVSSKDTLFFGCFKVTVTWITYTFDRATSLAFEFIIAIIDTCYSCWLRVRRDCCVSIISRFYAVIMALLPVPVHFMFATTKPIVAAARDDQFNVRSEQSLLVFYSVLLTTASTMTNSLLTNVLSTSTATLQ